MDLSAARSFAGHSSFRLGEPQRRRYGMCRTSIIFIFFASICYGSGTGALARFSLLRVVVA